VDQAIATTPMGMYGYSWEYLEDEQVQIPEARPRRRPSMRSTLGSGTIS
jgi:hypothetical protein